MQKKVLTIGCEKHIARLIEVNLQRQGYEVYCANDETTALHIARQGRPDIIVINAFRTTLIKQLQSDPKTKDIKIVTFPLVRGQDPFR